MPGGLPASTDSLDVIGPGNTFDEWVLILVIFTAVVTVLFEKVFSLGKGRWALRLELVVSKLCCHKMGFTVPSHDLGDLNGTN